LPILPIAPFYTVTHPALQQSNGYVTRVRLKAVARNESGSASRRDAPWASMACWQNTIRAERTACYDEPAPLISISGRRTTLCTNDSQRNQLISFWGGRRLVLCAAILILASIAGCNAKPAPGPKLRISMIPTTDPGKALRENQPLLAYWAKQTGRTPELTIPTSYAAVVEALANDKVDIAYLGGFTYVQASARAGVKPLVQRSIDQQFHSVFITPAGSKIHSLADLHGHFVFGDVNSTSGHLMPLYYMQQEEVDPEVITNASYSGGHDATALAVANGKAEAGAMDEQVYKKMLANGQLKPGAVRVFYTTPPFFDYVWVANKNLDPRIASAFANSMKSLSTSQPDQKALLDLLNAKGYVAANDADYGKLRDAAKGAGLLH
jgi:phosphonate transport system substrate-binding protein